MQITRNDISETKVEFTVKAGLEELTHAKQSELKERAKTMKVAGFREGKAPLSVIEKQVDSNELQAKEINYKKVVKNRIIIRRAETLISLMVFQ